MNKNAIEIEQTFNVPSHIIWNAITSIDEMKLRYFDIPGFKPILGTEFQFTAQGKDGTKQYVHLCLVKEVIEGKKLSYTWRYEGFTGDSLVSFELFEEGDTTRLKLSHTGLETFPSLLNPDLDKENFVQGWTYIMGTSLPEYIANQKAV